MSEPGANPWVDPGSEEYVGPQSDAGRSPVVATGPTQPHPGLRSQLGGMTGQVPAMAPSGPRGPGQGIWVVGVHGGAGESTIVALSPHLQQADHRWPPRRGRSEWCVLVARTNAAGLHNARAAAIDYAAGHEPHVMLLGLVLIPDAPGKLPKDLAREVTRTGGGVPRVWELPWVEAWRYHAAGYTQLDATDLPRPVKKMLADLAELTMLDVVDGSKENPAR
ncbi:DUF6668 family protein [Kribbella sp. NPDC048928]|uniref:DUF6668 family protein n=1 Tax=Kribbella sp. NPDC048928 TaxID=3364111 RepID=UPI003720C375